MGWLDNLRDKLESKSELRLWNKFIKKACKKHLIKDPKLMRMYLNIQKEVLDNVNKKEGEGVFNKEYFEVTPFNTIIKQRIYDLNREFILLINREFHNSCFALSRQIIEIYIRLIQCRKDINFVKKILEEERQKQPIKHTIDNLKERIDFPYIKGIDSKKFLDATLSWFYYFSNLFHLSGIGLSQNMWVFNKEKNLTRLYIKDPKLKEGEKLVIFSKKAIVLREQYFTMIHQFYTFSDLCLKELKLIRKKYETQNKTQKTEIGKNKKDKKSIEICQKIMVLI